LGGNHTWSFHAADLSPAQRRWMEPFVESAWDHYEVRFPGLRRRLSGGYHSITSERLHAAVSGALGDRVKLGANADIVSDRTLELSDGSRLSAKAVIDGRGGSGPAAWAVAYQKFLGLSLILDQDHGLQAPILMDATVEQRDGFRFIYSLPFSPRRILLEDTRYSDTATLSRAEMRVEIQRYAADMGWSVAAVEREEVGVLPIVLEGRVEDLWADSPLQVPRSGVRAGLFHPTTGYSLPDAVRLADDLATCPSLEPGALYRRIRGHAMHHWRRRRFFRLLNRMLFRAAEPAQRYRVLERFYGLPLGLIDRFYAGELSLFDRVRLVTGKPPVPMGKALRCLGENRGTSPTGGHPPSTLAGPE